MLGELLAISALVMCLLFILVDMGRPDRLHPHHARARHAQLAPARCSPGTRWC